MQSLYWACKKSVDSGNKYAQRIVDLIIANSKPDKLESSVLYEIIDLDKLRKIIDFDKLFADTRTIWSRCRTESNFLVELISNKGLLISFEDFRSIEFQKFDLKYVHPVRSNDIKWSDDQYVRVLFDCIPTVNYGTITGSTYESHGSFMDKFIVRMLLQGTVWSSQTTGRIV